MFENPPNLLTAPAENVLTTTITALADEPFQHCESVFERQVRYVINHEDKPVAALVPIIDLEMLKDLQTQVDANEWLQWVQEIRERLGWKPVAFGDEEETR